MARETVRQAVHEMDQQIADVMPDSEPVHGRLTIRNSDELRQEMEDKAISHLESVLSNNDYPAEKVAEKIIDKMT